MYTQLLEQPTLRSGQIRAAQQILTIKGRRYLQTSLMPSRPHVPRGVCVEGWAQDYLQNSLRKVYGESPTTSPRVHQIKSMQAAENLREHNRQMVQSLWVMYLGDCMLIGHAYRTRQSAHEVRRFCTCNLDIAQDTYCTNSRLARNFRIPRKRSAISRFLKF